MSRTCICGRILSGAEACLCPGMREAATRAMVACVDCGQPHGSCWCNDPRYLTGQRTAYAACAAETLATWAEGQ